ncbi:MAG: prepilin-type N-terminal cleavage/methylation domain-containing protein [Candidatus Omnitrophota bacterium]|nr:prepilin-type N-terminal cleavage/methylation domain-containing protein [Candidatus Omnitrophota bacterium]
MSRRGFTLIELLSVIVILAILVTIALPGFTRTTERAQQRQAWDMLQTIYASEQVFFSVNSTYSGTWADPVNPDLGDYMDNPNTPAATYTVVAGIGPLPTFTATATRSGAGQCGGATMTINQARTMGGPWLTCPIGGL